MATVLDTLILELGLDQTAFEKGQKDAARAMLKTREEMEKHSKELRQEVGEKLSDSFREATRHVVEFVAALAGARSLIEFGVGAKEAAESIGLLSVALGMAPQRIGAIEATIAQAGGTAEGAASALMRLQQARDANRMHGTPIPLGMSMLVGKLGTPEEMMESMVGNLDRIAGKDLQMRIALAQDAVGDLATAKYIATHSAKEMRAEFTKNEKYGPNEKQVEAAEEINRKWQEAAETVRQFGSQVMEVAAKPLGELLDGVTHLIEKNKDWMAAWIGDRVKWFDEYLATDGVKDWDAFTAELKKFWAVVTTIKDDLGGWVNASKVLLGLWVGANVMRAVIWVGKLALALTGLKAAATGVGFPGWLGKLGILGSVVGVTEALDPKGDFGGLTSGVDEWVKRTYGFDPSNMSLGWWGGGPKAKGPYNPGHKPRQKSWEDSANAIPLGDITFGGGRTVTEATPLPVTLVGQTGDLLHSLWEKITGGPSGMGGAAPAGGNGGAGSSGGSGWPGGGAHDLIDGSRDYAGLKLAGGQAVAGGSAQEGLLAIARHQQRAEGGYFTAINDQMHHGLPYHSAHVEGRAFDEAIPGGDYDAARERLRQYLTSQGVDPKDYWIEPRTRDHLHFQWNSAAAARAYAEKTGNRRPFLPAKPIFGGAGLSPAVTEADKHHSSIRGKTVVAIDSIHVHPGKDGAQMSFVERKLREQAKALILDTNLV